MSSCFFKLFNREKCEAHHIVNFKILRKFQKSKSTKKCINKFKTKTAVDMENEMNKKNQDKNTKNSNISLYNHSTYN